jgi:hypothetical protein
MIVRMIAAIPAHWIDYLGIAGAAFSIGYGLAAWQCPFGWWVW